MTFRFYAFSKRAHKEGRLRRRSKGNYLNYGNLITSSGLSSGEEWFSKMKATKSNSKRKENGFDWEIKIKSEKWNCFARINTRKGKKKKRRYEKNESEGKE